VGPIVGRGLQQEPAAEGGHADPQLGVDVGGGDRGDEAGIWSTGQTRISWVTWTSRSMEVAIASKAMSVASSWAIRTSWKVARFSKWP